MGLTKGSKPSHTAPRVKTRLTKSERKLAERRKIYEKHGKNPQNPNNPSSGHTAGHDMHQPGSQNLRKRV